jgi:phosphatidate cytidylyltransferase
VIIGGFLIITALTAFFQKQRPDIINLCLWMMLGSIYIGWLLSLIVLLRIAPATITAPELGRNLVYLTLFTTFGNDTLAYFSGRFLGRHQMAPRVSPKKTWEGAMGGVAGGIIVALLFTLDTPLQVPFNTWQAVTFGIACSIFGQAGDLAESALKRFAGVKDSGILFPGHGGILDRIDSILLAGIVTFVYYIFVIH